MKNPKFHQLLRARGVDVNLLAYFIDSKPTHVSQVLNNIPGRGGKTRRKLFKWLMPEEIEALGWTEEYRDWLKNGGARRDAATFAAETAARGALSST